MTISEMIKHLEEKLKEYGDLDLYQSSDDEGNNFFPVRYNPELRFVRKDEKGDSNIDHLYSKDEFFIEGLTDSDVDQVLLI